MLSDRFGQSNKFWKKSLKKNWNIEVWVLWRSSRGRPENVLPTCRVNFPGTFLECQIRTSPWRSNWIFRVHLGDVGEGRPQDVLGTNIWRLGWFSSGSCAIWSSTLGMRFLRFLTSVPWGILPSTNLVDCAEKCYTSLIFLSSLFSIFLHRGI